MIMLLFPLDGVLLLAEHAAAASEHSPSFAQRLDGRAGVASLLWVKDDGTYLMTNGIPRPQDPERLPDADAVLRPVIRRSGPASPSGSLGELGGDDFVEYLALADRFGDHASLLDAIRAFHAQGL